MRIKGFDISLLRKISILIKLRNPGLNLLYFVRAYVLMKIHISNVISQNARNEIYLSVCSGILKPLQTRLLKKNLPLARKL